MVRFVLIAFFSLAGMAVFGQSAGEAALIERTYQLSSAVFGSRDSVLLEDLFAKKLTYGHSGGKLEARDEALRNILQNRSFYTDTLISDIQVLKAEKAAVVRYRFKAKEHKPDHSVSNLHFSMMLVWIKEKGKWRLMGRQAVRL